MNLWYITTCMGRRDFLKETLGPLVADGHNVVLVDYSCPQECGNWAKETYPDVQVVSVHGKDHFEASKARNAGAAVVPADALICFIDSDVIVSPGFGQSIFETVQHDSFGISDVIDFGFGGVIAVWKQDFELAGGFDEVFEGYSDEDTEFKWRLGTLRLKKHFLKSSYLKHMQHGHWLRVSNHKIKNINFYYELNRAYRHEKQRLFKERKSHLSTEEAVSLYARLRAEIMTRRTGRP